MQTRTGVVFSFKAITRNGTGGLSVEIGLR